MTDKTTHNRTNDLCYLDIYENYFKKYQNDKISLLEIGVRGGHSLRTWTEYFPHALIYGVDVTPACKQYESDRVKILISDATKKETFKDTILDFIKYDIIIDDGSHINSDIISTFNILWSKLSSGGIYIIEDLYNSYGTRPLEILKDSSGTPQNHRGQILPFFGMLMDQVNTPSKDKLAIHFWDSICIILKT